MKGKRARGIWREKSQTSAIAREKLRSAEDAL